MTDRDRDPQPGQDRRQALVLAAFECIATKGFEGLRLRDVAAGAGIDHSTLHHYFPTKQDLVGEVVAYATRKFWPTMPADGSPADRLRHHLASLSELVQEQPKLFVVLGELDLRAHRDAAIRSIIDEHEAGWRAALAEVLESGALKARTEAGCEPGRSDDLDVADTVELIIASVKGIVLLPDRAADTLGQLARLLTADRRYRWDRRDRPDR